MRVLAATTWYPSGRSSNAVPFIWRHLEAIGRGHEVTVACIGPASHVPLPLEGARLVHLAASPRQPWTVGAAAYGLSRLDLEVIPDIVHTMGLSSLLYPPAAGLSRPWVHTEHWGGVVAPHAYGPLVGTLAPIALQGLRLPDRVTVVSRFLAVGVRRWAPHQKVSVVPNVVDLHGRPSPRPVQTPPRLLHVANLVDVKRPLLLVEAFARVLAAEPGAELRMAGDGPLRTVVEARLAELGIGDRVRVLGSLPHAELTDHFAWSTHVVLPSRVETFSVAAAEALGHQRPVITGLVGGHRDFVTPAVGAFLADDTPGGLCDLVLAEHQRWRGDDGARCAEAVQGRFTPAAIAEDFDQVYREMVR